MIYFGGNRNINESTATFPDFFQRLQLGNSLDQLCLSLGIINLTGFVRQGFFRQTLGFKRRSFINILGPECGICQNSYQQGLNLYDAA
jgi:hypothetical protein